MALQPPDDGWGLLLDEVLPDSVGLLDDLQLDCTLPTSLDDLDCLALDLDTAAVPSPVALDAVADMSGQGGPATSDFLDSLQMDASAFSHPTSSSGARYSPSGSGRDSPVVLPLLVPTGAGASVAPVAGLPQLQQPRSSCDMPSNGNSQHQLNRSSPATSESENNGQRDRSASPGAVASAQRAAHASGKAAEQAQRPLTEDEKRLARMQRNRENAQLSRQRKKQQMSDLEQRCALLTQQNTQLTVTVQRLTAENATLRQQLALICQQAGRNTAAASAAAAARPGSAPAVATAGTAAQPAAAPAAAGSAQADARPSVATPAAAAHPGAAAVSAAAGVRPAPAAPVAVPGKGMLPQWPLLPFGFLPKMNLAAMQQQRAAAAAMLAAGKGAATPAGAVPTPAAASAAKPAAAAAQAAATAAAGGRANKRARTAAGASTAFLALFTLFMFAGPLTPVPPTTVTSNPAVTIAAAGAASHTALPLRALPEAGVALGASVDASGLQHGRRLQALPAAASSVDDSGSRHDSLPLPHQAPLPLDASQPDSAVSEGLGMGGGSGGGGRLQQLLNSTLQALLLEPGNAALEAAALQRLQELGPVALLLDADDASPGAAFNPLAASHAFPQLAGQLFGSAGLAVPQMCTKVLEFDAASVPHAARSRRSLERYLLGTTGFRGRSLSLAALTGSTAGAEHGGSATGVPQPPVTAGAAGPVVVEDEEQQEPLRIEEPGSDALGGKGSASTSGSARSKQVLVPGGSEEPVLVSIILPANASGGGNNSKLAAADKVFVVLLHPQDKYVTYSCALPRAVVL